jgi:FkbM family methyltransferase
MYREIKERIVRSLYTFPASKAIEFYIRWRRKSLKVARVQIGSLKYFCDPSEGVGMELANKGSYEPGTTAIFSSLLTEGINVIDIGANIGYYTILAARRIGNGVVFSFEPEPFNFSLLQKNCDENQLRNVRLYRLALSDKRSRSQLYLSPTNSGGHSLFRRGRIFPSIAVETSSLDLILPDIDVGVVKIDVEGSELQVLRGMRNTIRKNKNIRMIVEYNPFLLLQAGVGADYLLNEIESLGFSFRAISERTGKALPLDHPEIKNELLIEGHVNLVCERR